MPAFSPHVLGVLLALSSAVVWGSGDFSGGLATRRLDAFKVLAIVSLVGVVLLATIALIVGEPVPRMMTVFWAAAGGLAGALGIAALYKGLSLGNAAGVAPLSAVIGAVLPVAFGSATEGLPRATQFAGIVIAIIGIWLVTRVPDGARGMTRREVLLSVLAGSGFGCFFILIAQVPDGEIFAPLVVARAASLAAGVAVLVVRRQSVGIAAIRPIVVLAGILDAGGNVLYLMAKQFTRLDVAAVLASLYPATTVILARLILKENVSRPQWAGVAVCIIAVALIAL